MRKSICYLLIGIIFFTNCKKNDYLQYNDTTRLQFGPDPYYEYKSGYELMDTLKSYTFVYDSELIVRDTVYFDIYTLGKTSSVDRPFALEQVLEEGAENAIPEVHYVGFDNSEAIKNYIIPADSAHAKVPIILLRDKSLKDTSITLKFQIAANNEFQLGQEENLWRRVVFTDKLSQPSTWTASMSQYYFGQYSVVKHQFMIDNTGQKWDDTFITNIMSDYAALQYWVGVCKTALVRYNNEHPSNPLMDEQNQLIIFP